MRNRIKSTGISIALMIGLLPTALHAFNVEELNYETLAKDAYTEHVIAFRCLFSVTKIGAFLELGMGRGTKYFLDHCDQVTSLEISIESRAKDIDLWCLECLDSYRSFQKWTPKFYRSSKVMDFYNRSYALNYWLETQAYFPDYLEEYLSEVNAICNDLLKERSYDVVFIDPGIFTRADFVNAFFGRVGIIVAHDTHTDYYGWPRVVNHPDYERIDHKANYEGTTFWIHKTKKKLIEDLKAALNLSQ